jgi:hypothetical protein
MGLVAPVVRYMASTSPGWTSTAGAIAEGATAVIALLALLGTVRQLRQTRAHEYLRRFNDPQLLAYMDKTQVAVIRQHVVADDIRVDVWEKMSFSDQLDALLYLNFWEEMASMYNRRLINRKIISDDLGGAALDYWQLAKWLIVHLRSQYKDDGFYGELEKMCRDIRHRQCRRGLVAFMLKPPTPAPAQPRASSWGRPRRRS